MLVLLIMAIVLVNMFTVIALAFFNKMFVELNKLFAAIVIGIDFMLLLHLIQIYIM